MAAELGGDKIRVNTVNPDGVIVGSKIWEGEWAEGRAKAMELPLTNSLHIMPKEIFLNEIIYPEDIAEAVFSLLVV